MATSASADALRPSWSLALLVTGGVLAVVLARNVIGASTTVLGWALASIVVAMVVAPLVALGSRLMPRGVAIALVFLVLVAGGLALRAAYTTELRSEADFLAERGPEIAQEVEARDDRLGQIAREFALVDRVTEFTDRIDEGVGTTGDAIRSAALSAPAYFVSLILTIFFLVFGPGMVNAGLERLPARRRRRARRAVHGAARSTQLQVGAALATGVVVGTAAWVAGQLLGVPAAALLGLVAGVLSIVPYVGVLLGWMPILLLGLGVAPAWQVMIVVIVAISLQVVEATRWRPFVDGRSVYVGPAAVVVSTAVGWAIYGLGGAVVLLVVTMFLLAVADEVASDDDVPTPIDDYVEA